MQLTGMHRLPEPAVPGNLGCLFDAGGGWQPSRQSVLKAGAAHRTCTPTTGIIRVDAVRVADYASFGIRSQSTTGALEEDLKAIVYGLPTSAITFDREQDRWEGWICRHGGTSWLAMRTIPCAQCPGWFIMLVSTGVAPVNPPPLYDGPYLLTPVSYLPWLVRVYLLITDSMRMTASAIPDQPRTTSLFALHLPAPTLHRQSWNVSSTILCTTPVVRTNGSPGQRGTG